MRVHPPVVGTCPHCGGILQPTEPERLTAPEFAATEARTGPRQCLICGYEAPVRAPEDPRT
jgi:hypothetical protein